MFGDLDRYGKGEYFQSHRHGNLYFNGANHGVEVCAYFLVDAHDEVVYSTAPDSVPGTEEWLAYLKGHAV